MPSCWPSCVPPLQIYHKTAWPRLPELVRKYTMKTTTLNVASPFGGAVAAVPRWLPWVLEAACDSRPWAFLRKRHARLPCLCLLMYKCTHRSRAPTPAFWPSSLLPSPPGILYITVKGGQGFGQIPVQISGGIIECAYYLVRLCADYGLQPGTAVVLYRVCWAGSDHAAHSMRSCCIQAGAAPRSLSISRPTLPKPSNRFQITTQDGVSDPADWPSELAKPAPWGDLSSNKFAFAAPFAELKKWLPTRPDKITQFYDVVQAGTRVQAVLLRCLAVELQSRLLAVWLLLLLLPSASLRLFCGWAVLFWRHAGSHCGSWQPCAPCF